MKKEIERMEKQYNIEITLQMEKSDALDNRSARYYRIYTIFGMKDNYELDLICEYGYCKNWKQIVEKFEKRIIERLGA